MKAPVGAAGAARTVVLTGTDPDSRSGGIGHALPGYMGALSHAGIDQLSIPSYHPTRPGGRYRPWLSAMFRVPATVHRLIRARVRVVVYSHAGAGWSLAREGLLLAVARRAGARTIIQLHAPEVDRYLAHAGGRALLRAALSRADVVAVLTPWWRDRLATVAKRMRIEVIPNPLPPELEHLARHPPEPRLGAYPHAKLNLLAMTRLVQGKGVDVAIESLAHLPDDVRLTIAGDGPERSALERLALRHGVAARVQFAGWLAGAAKQEALRSADVFCLPSTLDSFGMGFIEAMAHGIPVVAVRSGAIPDVVPNDAGALVDAADAVRVAEAVARLRDAGLREKAGATGRAWVLERFSSAAVGTRLESVVASLAS